MQSEQILKEFGFQIEEKKEVKLPSDITLVIKSGQHYTIKTNIINKISALIANMIETNDHNNSTITLPDIIDEKYMAFLIDYVEFIEHQNQTEVPVYNVKKIESATTLENAIGAPLHKLFEKHFNYKFVRSDLAVKQYLKIFGYFLKASNVIISEPLMTLFAIAHKIILQHLPSSEFIIIDE